MKNVKQHLCLEITLEKIITFIYESHKYTIIKATKCSTLSNESVLIKSIILYVTTYVATLALSKELSLA